MAKLGFGFSVEVNITPKDGGGSWGTDPTFIHDLNEYLITVKITRNEKVWKYSLEANRFEMKSLERIMVSFKKINTIVESVTFAIKQKTINMKNILIEVFKK